MLRYYLAVALRNLARSKLYAAISIGGLAIGFAAAALIAIYVHDEINYDRWLPNHERIYQVSAGGPGGAITGVAPADVGQWLALDFPHVTAVTRLFPAGAFLQRSDVQFNEQITWTDANFFEVFQFPVVAGDLRIALERPDSLVLTRSLSEKYFGRPDALGESLLLNGTHAMEVTAVIEDLPSSTHLQITVIGAGHATYSPAAEQDRNPLQRFGGKLWNTRTYVLLPPGESADALRLGIPAMLDRRTPSQGGGKVSEAYAMNVRPIAAIHLSSGMIEGPDSNFGRIYTVAAIGALILLAASINFVNLLTTFGMRRAVEVGVRKANGAARRDLFAQFMSESFVYVIAGAAAGLVLAAALLPAFNAFLLRSMDFAILGDAGLLGGALIVVVVLAFLAGVYPATVLSSFRPAIVIKARTTSARAAGVRHALVVLQFAILIGLLIATAVVYRQMSFGTREALRQNTDPILLVQNACSDAFKNKVQDLAGVRGTACAQILPQWGVGAMTGLRPSDGDGVPVRYAAVDFGFFELYGLNAVAGRFFSAALGTDAVPQDNVWTTPEALVINERAAERLGFGSAEEAVGEVLTFNHLFRMPSTFTGDHDAQIIGVVEDFQMGPIRGDIQPAAFFVHPAQLALLSVKLDGTRLPETIEALERIWDEAGGPGPLNRFFFEDSIQNMYLDIRRQADFFGLFAGIAVLISMLGLIGLAAQASAARTKEIGIRKALGGNRATILRLLLWQFSKPVLWANVIAWPVAYFLMNLWLQAFARRIDLELWPFVTAGAITLLLALATVFTHAYAMAGTRPVEVLRDE
jgi:putative ABC transport system permease protein